MGEAGKHGLNFNFLCMTLVKKDVLELIKKTPLAILSTVNADGLPNAAPIYFIADEALNFFFITPQGTQKHLNLLNQNEVVLTLVDETYQATLQVRGKAKEEPEKMVEVFKSLAKKLNQDGHFLTNLPLFSYKNQDKIAIKISPDQIRMRRYRDDDMEEIIL